MLCAEKAKMIQDEGFRGKEKPGRGSGRASAEGTDIGVGLIMVLRERNIREIDSGRRGFIQIGKETH